VDLLEPVVAAWPARKRTCLDADTATIRGCKSREALANLDARPNRPDAGHVIDRHPPLVKDGAGRARLGTSITGVAIRLDPLVFVRIGDGEHRTINKDGSDALPAAVFWRDEQALLSLPPKPCLACHRRVQNQATQGMVCLATHPAISQPVGNVVDDLSEARVDLNHFLPRIDRWGFLDELFSHLLYNDKSMLVQSELTLENELRRDFRETEPGDSPLLQGVLL
jgi:hypothetical protein